MNIPEASASTTVCKGRERTCAHCGAVYQSPRASRYCSNACRCRAKRGYSPKPSAPTGTASFTVIGRMLLKLGMVGLIGPAMVYGLTVPADYALAELRLIMNRKGWGQLSEPEFTSALKTDGIRRFTSDSPEATARKRLQARQRVATARL